MDVNNQNQVSDTFQPPTGTIKRKRGRPRKQPRRIPAKNARTWGTSLPGFEGASRSQPQPVGPVNYMSPMVGQVVTGVIEADFEGGYLLSVRVGNSDTRLNGVIFKSGYYVPVSPGNDIAPGLQMIMPVIPQNDRTTPGVLKNIPVPPENGAPPGFEAPLITSQPAVLASPKNRLNCPIPSGRASAPKGSKTHRGSTPKPFTDLVSVAKSTNGGASRSASQPPHLAATKNNPIIPIKSDLAGEPISSEMHELVKIAKMMTEAPLSTETQDSGFYFNNKMLGDDSSFTQNAGEDLISPPFSEPLQTIDSGMPSLSAPMPPILPEGSTGNMTDLLLSMQRKAFKDPK